MTLSAITRPGVAVEIGGMPIVLCNANPSFRAMLESRYAGFVKPPAEGQFEFDIHLHEPAGVPAPDEDVQVSSHDGRWRMKRGDFEAEWDSRAGRGRVQQSPNPYAIDSVLRIVHTLLLAPQGGFLVHAASAIRQGRAFLFAGVSGAGKTTISRLAPADAVLLTDEISYVRPEGDHYAAWGTPFAGELATSGENRSAPLQTLFILEQGRENRIVDIASTEAVRLLLRNILFFAHDTDLVRRVLQSACEFVERVPVKRLSF
ncbi:MAG TPA: hypothetical protein VGF08_09820, partial [Terriglobales bacterium]